MGNTLGDLLGKFASTVGNDVEEVNDDIHEQLLEGETKTASDGGNEMSDMGSLASLFMSMADLDKTAAAEGDEYFDTDEEPLLTEEDIEKIASAEAGEIVSDEYESSGGGEDMMKIAAEYDAAGRIMARGFWDEYTKLASAMDTSVEDNQGTDALSAAQTPSFGQRDQLPTLATNYAGQPQAGIKSKQVGIDTSGGQEVYKNSLKPTKTRSAGDIGDDPEGHALAIGGGSPSGFATVRDVMGSNR